jgi:hypothetical protein
LPDGTQARIENIQAAVQIVAPLRIPQMFLELAQWAVGQALRPGAEMQATMLVIVLVSSAAEAVVNTLIEENVGPAEWHGPGRKGLVWKSPREKWVRLSHILKMRPEFSPDRPPLRQLIETIEVRNALMHFQHGKNLVHSQLPLPVSYDRGQVAIDSTPMLLGQEGIVVRDAELRKSLQVGHAEAYYDSLVSVLRPVLAVCPEDSVETVGTLRQIIERPDHIELGKTAEPT